MTRILRNPTIKCSIKFPIKLNAHNHTQKLTTFLIYTLKLLYQIQPVPQKTYCTNVDDTRLLV